MSLKGKITAAAATAALAGGGMGLAGTMTASASTARPASTVSCFACIHVQNDYAFRGALDAEHQGTAVNTPIILWYERPTTTDPGADLLVISAGTVTNHGEVNQSPLDWTQYKGDSVVRFKYDPFGNGGANTYIGLNGPAGRGTLALRNDNPNSIWQEFIEVPVSNVGAALPAHTNACASGGHCVLIDVGETANTNDPMVVTDPGDAFTGSLVQQDTEPEIINQAGHVATNQVWDFQN